MNKISLFLISLVILWVLGFDLPLCSQSWVEVINCYYVIHVSYLPGTFSAPLQ